MSKYFRRITLLVLSFFACLTMGLGLMFSNVTTKPIVVSANTNGTFVIEQGAAARISTNCGIRFTAYFDQAFYNEIVEGNEIKSGYQLGMIIVPAYYYEDCDNYIYNTGYDGGYYEYFRDIKGKMIDLNFEYSDIVEDATYGYSVRGAIVNMKENNLDLEYAAIAYLKSTTVDGEVYRYTGISLSRSVRYVAARAIEDNADGADKLTTLYGMSDKASYTVNTYLQSATGEYVLSDSKSLYKYATIGTTVDYSSNFPEIDGYMLNASKSTLTGVVAQDGSLSLDLYYLIDKGFAISQGSSNSAYPITTDSDVVYKNEFSSTKLHFNNLKYANFTLTALHGISSVTEGYVTFYVKNMTGIELDIYTNASLSVLNAVTPIANTTDWQEIKLYVDNSGSSSIDVCLRSKNEATTLGNDKYIYISNVSTEVTAPIPGVVEPEEDMSSGVMYDFSDNINAVANGWVGSYSHSTDFQYNGQNTLKIEDNSDNMLAFGVFLDTTKLAQLLALEGHEGVRLSFNYYLHDYEWNCNYVELGGVKQGAIKDTWTSASVVLTEVPDNFILCVTSGGWGTSAKGYLYISNVTYELIVPVLEDSGVLYDFSNNVNAVASGWVGSYSHSTEDKYNGQNTLRIEDNSDNMLAFGVFLDTTKLAQLLALEGHEGVRLSFNYYLHDYEWNCNYVELGGVKQGAIKDTWTSASVVLTEVPDNFILCVTSGGWGTSAKGYLCVSSITYELVKPLGDSGVMFDFSNNVNAVTSWVGSYSHSTDVQYDGQNTLKIEDNSDNMIAFGVFLDKTLLAQLLALDGHYGVKLSFNYYLHDYEWNCNYVELGGVKQGAIKDTWTSASVVLTEVPDNFILCVTSGGWGTSAKGYLYISNVTYELVKAQTESGVLYTFNEDFDSISDKWVGSYEWAQFDGRNTLKIADNTDNMISFGAFLQRSALENLFAKVGVVGVKLTFDYYLHDYEWNCNYIELGGIRHSITKDAWTSVSFVLTEVPENFILCITSGSYGTSAKGYAYISNIMYELVVDGAELDNSNYQMFNLEGASISRVDGEDITKVEIASGMKSAGVVIKSNNAIATNAIQFSILNKTGREFYVYTNAFAWSGKVKVRVSNAWQTVTLYVPSGTKLIDLSFETVNGRTFNPTQDVAIYMCDYKEVAAPSSSSMIVYNGNTDYQIVYANDASSAEINAALTLQKIIEDATGVNLRVSNYSSRTQKNYIAVGDGLLYTSALDSDDPDAYCIKKVSKNIYIYGVSDRGTSYGVLDFLYIYFGYVYTDDDYTVDSVDALSFEDVQEDFFEPTVSMRSYIGYDTVAHIYNGVMFRPLDQELCFNTKQNTEWSEGVWETDYNWAAHSGALEKFGYYDEKVHTTQNTLNAGVALYNAKYGTSLVASNYYSSNNSAVDICFTKTIDGVSTVDLVAYAIESLIENKYAQGVRYYTLEQEDFSNTICTCYNCSKAANALKGMSGLNIWFVNQVIDKIDSDGYADYDYKLTIFAYHQTEEAPTAIASYAGVNTSKTYSNVANERIVIKFAFINQSYFYGVYDSRVESKAMLDSWKPFMGEETMFWLYDTSFTYYAGYFSALNAIADNVYAAKLFNASTVLINGAYDAPHDWDQKLRRYVYSKMLWNFDEARYSLGDQDGDGVTDYVKDIAMEYLNSYYGVENGALVWDIIKAYESSSQSKNSSTNNKLAYNLGATFYKTQFDKIFLGNGSTTGVYYTSDETLKLRLKEVLMSVVADLKYVAGTSSYGGTNVSVYFGTTDTRTIFKQLADEVGFTQWSEDYDADGSNRVEDRY